MAKATTSTAMTMRTPSFIKTTIAKYCAAGMASIGTNFLPGSRKRIGYRLVWKDNLSVAERFRRASRNVSSLVQKNWNRGCLLPLPTAPM